MCRLRNIAMCDYQKSVTIPNRQTDRRMDEQTPDKVILMCRYASQATQKYTLTRCIHETQMLAQLQCPQRQYLQKIRTTVRINAHMHVPTLANSSPLSQHHTFLGQKRGQIKNNGLGRWLNAKRNGQSLVWISCIQLCSKVKIVSCSYILTVPQPLKPRDMGLKRIASTKIFVSITFKIIYFQTYLTTCIFFIFQFLLMSRLKMKGVLVLLWTLYICCLGEDAATKPHIILIVADDLVRM